MNDKINDIIKSRNWRWIKKIDHFLWYNKIKLFLHKCVRLYSGVFYI